MNLFDTPSKRLRKRLLKAGGYDESKHPRDERGRWTDTGSTLGTGRFTTTGAGLGLSTSELGLLTSLRLAASPVEFIRSSEGQGVRVKDGPWRRVSLREAGFDRPGDRTRETVYALRRKDLVRNHEGGSVLVRMVDQRDWWNP